MPNLPESETYEANIYQLETSDPVDAGANGNGVSNLQAKQLANRSAWLRAQLLALLVGGNAGNPVSVAKGGLGANNSTRAAGQIPYTAAEGIIDWLATTAYGRSLLNQASALETAQALNLGLGKLEFDVNATLLTTTSDIFQDVGLGVTITPQSVDSQFLLLGVMSMRIVQNSGNNATAFMNIFRGAVPGGVSLGEKRMAGQFNSAITLLALSSTQVVAAVDAPNTTSPVTYNAAIRNVGTGETTINFNANSTLLCLEILP